MAVTWKKVAYEDDVITKALFDAHTVLYATTDDTPAALSVTEQTLVGRLTGGNISAVAMGITDNNMLQVNDADLADNDWLHIDGVGVDGFTDGELLGELSGDAAAAFDWGGQDLTNLGVLFLTEQAAAEVDVGDKGQFWVKSGAPNTPWFTDDGGTDVQLGLGAAHAILDGSVHSDSVAQGVTRGSIVYGNATPAWDELVLGGADTFVGSDGTDVSYRTAAQVMASLSGDAAAAFDFNGQEIQGFVVHTVANAAGRPAAGVGKVVWQTDELCLYACTIAV